jgi:hypothetical protein
VSIGNLKPLAKPKLELLVVRVVYRQLLADAVLVLAQGVDPTAYRSHALADVPVQPVTVDGRIALPTSASEPRVRAFHARGSSVIWPLSLAPFQ